MPVVNIHREDMKGFCSICMTSVMTLVGMTLADAWELTCSGTP